MLSQVSFFFLSSALPKPDGVHLPQTFFPRAIHFSHTFPVPRAIQWISWGSSFQWTTYLRQLIAIVQFIYLTWPLLLHEIICLTPILYFMQIIRLKFLSLPHVLFLPALIPSRAVYQPVHLACSFICIWVPSDGRAVASTLRFWPERGTLNTLQGTKQLFGMLQPTHGSPKGLFILMAKVCSDLHVKVCSWVVYVLIALLSTTKTDA